MAENKSGVGLEPESENEDASKNTGIRSGRGDVNKNYRGWPG